MKEGAAPNSAQQRNADGSARIASCMRCTSHMPAAALAVLLLTAHAHADFSPSRVTVNHDGAEGPSPQPITQFFTVGEPLAYVDWLCLESERDLGAEVVVRLSRITALDESGVALGGFTSASGADHAFSAHHVPIGNGLSRYRYCTRVLPREWRADAVRFAAEHDASRVTGVSFAVDGDSRCAGAECGRLAPRLTGFTYGASAAAFSQATFGFWQSAELSSAGLGPGVTRFRLGASVPLLYITVGWPKSLRLAAHAGFTFPVTVASSALEGGGSALGAAVGAYWAQCLELRAPLVPRVCLGAEVDAALEGAMRGGALDDVRPRALFSWFLALGLGPR